MNRRDEILSKVRSVPSMPAVALEVMRTLQDPDFNIAGLMRAIEHDPGLASNLLRLANSAYFGYPGSVGSVRDAIVRLGTSRIFQMVMASAVTPLARRAIKGYDLPPGALWEHSVAVAIGVEQLAAALDLQPPDYAFTAALLHDVGKVVLGTFVEVDAAPIMTLAFQDEVSFEVAEHRVLGIDHAEVGAALLESWNLPSCIVEADRWHHQPEGFPGEPLVVDLVHAADTLCLMGGIGTGSDGLNYRPSREVVSRLNLTARVAEMVVCRILSGLEELRNLFAADTSGRRNHGPQHS